MSTPTAEVRDDTTQVVLVLIRYLEGHYYGDTEKLRSTMSPAESCFAPVNPAPADLGESYTYRIVNIEIDGDRAVATLTSRMTAAPCKAALHRTRGDWRIDSIANPHERRRTSGG